MSKVKYSLFLLLFFYVIFPFSFDAIHLEQDLLVLALSAMVIVMNLGFIEKKIRYFNVRIVFSLVIFTFLCALSLLVPIVMGTGDFTFFRILFFASIQMIIKYLAVGILFVRLFGKKATFKQLANMYILSCCLYLLITFIFVAVPTLKTTWMDILYISDLDIVQMNKPQYASRVGIDGFAGFGQSFKFTFGAMLNIYCILKNNYHDKNEKIRYYLSLILLTLGTLLYGRIGSVVTLLGMAVLVIFMLSELSTVKKGLVFIASLILFFVLLVMASFFNESIRVWFEWSFEIVLTFIRTGEFSSASTDILFNQMYFLPDLKSFFVGNGYFTDPVTGSYFMRTDVGFMRSLLFYGIVPTLLTYSLFIFLFNGIYEKMSEFKKMRIVVIFLIAMMFLLFEIKGGIYHVFFPMLLPFYMILLHENKQKSGEEIIL